MLELQDQSGRVLEACPWQRNKRSLWKALQYHTHMKTVFLVNNDTYGNGHNAIYYKQDTKQYWQLQHERIVTVVQ